MARDESVLDDGPAGGWGVPPNRSTEKMSPSGRTVTITTGTGGHPGNVGSLAECEVRYIYRKFTTIYLYALVFLWQADDQGTDYASLCGIDDRMFVSDCRFAS